jgi:hypothetical protein
MNKNLIVAGVTVLSVGLWTAGCHPKAKTIVENDIQWDSVRVEKTYHLADKPENPNCNLQISFTYPAGYKDEAILKAVQQEFIRSYFGEPYEGLSPAEAVERYVERYLSDYKELEEDFAEATREHEHEHEHADHAGHEAHDHSAAAGAWFSYIEFSSNEIKYNKNDILCYAVFYESYTGGAHGSHSYMNHIIDLKTGTKITEEDIFEEAYQDALAKLLVEKIAKENQLKDPQELRDMGFFSVEEIYPNGNFSIDDTGITYYFNELEIAAYVVGITSVSLTYDEIKPLLREDAKIKLPIDN